MTITEYAIALKLPEHLAKKAAEMNQRLAAALPGHENVPNNWHVTLYHGAYDESDLDQIESLVKTMEAKQFAAKFIGSKYNTGNRWIDWKVEDTDTIHNLHKAVVALASLYHQRPLERSSDPLVYNDSLPPAKKAQIDKYGVTGIDSEEGQFYNPHTTLFYEYPPYADLATVLDKVDLGNETEEFTFTEIIIGKLGFNGNIVEVRDVIPLAPLADLTGQVDVAGAAAGFATDIE